MSVNNISASVWEKESFFKHRDIIIAGAGLSGLWAAYHLKKKNPKLSIAILERGLIPAGASTRNAGFACFGSLTELIHDRQLYGQEEMLSLTAMRFNGLRILKDVFRDGDIGYVPCGGFELLTNSDKAKREELADQMVAVNQMLSEVLPVKDAFVWDDHNIVKFGFAGLKGLIKNPYEGYLHSGKLLEQLLQLVQAAGVHVFFGANIHHYTKTATKICVQADHYPELTCSQLLVCTNAFATDLLPQVDVEPARGQMLLTSEISDLKFHGTFHADEGYYYFRNLGNRILIGGARNTDFTGERTREMFISEPIQTALEDFLQTYIIPDTAYEITDRWSGIMAMGSEKMPVVKEIAPGVFCSVRMSGMGVALTPVTGEIIASLMV